MSVLGKQEILRRIKEETDSNGRGGIFLKGTWDEERLRAAAYDLRVSPTYLITPDGSRYWPKSPGAKEHTASFKLDPREVAFVSSVECFSMPHDLAGNIATRFRVALEGILVMGGLLIDPRYEGRLHFQLVNIGEESIKIKPGTTSVAAVQFLPVIGAVEDSKAPDSQGLLDELFYEGAEKKPLPQLAFFSDVQTLKTDLGDVNDKVNEQAIELDSTRRSTDQLLVFGVFLVSITLFAVAIGVIVDALTGKSVDDAASIVGGTDLTLAGVAVAGFFLLVVGLVCYLMMKPVVRIALDRKEKLEASVRPEATEDPPS
jgi:deoxycytidine triphosphate deaminase